MVAEAAFALVSTIDISVGFPKACNRVRTALLTIICANLMKCDDQGVMGHCTILRLNCCCLTACQSNTGPSERPGSARLRWLLQLTHCFVKQQLLLAA